jgi:hypothetical protein
MLNSKILLNFKGVSQIATNLFHTTSVCNELRLLSRMRVVDNSEIGKKAMMEGKPPKIIHVYNKTHVGLLGDRVRTANIFTLVRYFKVSVVGFNGNQRPEKERNPRRPQAESESQGAQV